MTVVAHGQWAGCATEASTGASPAPGRMYRSALTERHVRKRNVLAGFQALERALD